MSGIVTLPVKYPPHCIRGTLEISSPVSVSITLELIGVSMEMLFSLDVTTVTIVTEPVR